MMATWIDSEWPSLLGMRARDARIRGGLRRISTRWEVAAACLSSKPLYALAMEKTN